VSIETYQQRCTRVAKELKAEASKATKLEKDLSIAIGCIDADRCNGQIVPSGSCDECIINAIRAVKELHEKGYRF
jgi:hypothetical protein